MPQIESPGILVTLLGFVLVLGPLVFIHELGHYLVGRLFGVKADVFSIGFGKELAGWTDKRARAGSSLPCRLAATFSLPGT